MKAFISYSHRDEAILDRLHVHLAMLRREGLIDEWYDRAILAGADIDADIARHLDESKVFIAIVSPDFLHSNYCYETEMQRAIERVDSRVYSESQKSRLVRLNSTVLPDDRHLFNIVNSQNNERIFFSDKVVLVEGLSDRIVFERVLDLHGRSQAGRSSVEVVAVGGKGLFEAYGSVLNACKIPFALIADQDYLEQVGSEEIAKLFVVNAREIKEDVIQNAQSLDGDALVKAIDGAIEAGNWDDAKGVWDYIKSSRRELRKELSGDETSKLHASIASLRQKPSQQRHP